MLVTAALVLGVPFAAQAAGTKTLAVDASATAETEGNTYKTIQGAINYINKQDDKTGWTIAVGAGEYERFAVFSGLDGLTIKAAENADVTVNTLDGHTPEGVEFSAGQPDLGGIQLWDADDVTLEGIKVVVGTVRSNGGSGHHMDAGISNHSESSGYADNFTIRECVFVGNGSMSAQGNGNVGISISRFDSFTIEGCTFSGLMEGIRGQSDNANVKQASICDNTFVGCSFAVHEYAGDSDRNDPDAAQGTYQFCGNTVTGTDDLYNKAYFEDLYVDNDKQECNGYAIEVSGNTFENAVIGLVNLEDNGGTTAAVLKGNTMDDNSFVVSGSKVSGQIEMHSNYAAPEDGYGHWEWTGKEEPEGGGNPSDAEETIKAAIDKANEEGSHTLTFGVDDPNDFLLTFTWFKDMIYWVTDDAPIEPVQPEWEVSKSKKATNLDANYESTVTLSLPAADLEPEVDVVLVVDVSSSMKEKDIAEAKAAAIAMCEELAAKDKLNVKVGIVTFDKEAHDLTDGLVSIDKAKTAISGISASESTNMMAGLVAGKDMLDKGTADDSCKYMVLMSDGIPIYWMKDGEPTSKVLQRYAKDETTLISTIDAGSEPEGSIAGEQATEYIDSMMSVSELMGKEDVATDSNEWKQVSDTGETINPDECRYTNIEKSTYMTGRYLQDQILGQYGFKMVAFGTDKYENNVVYTWGENFCDWIGGLAGADNYFKVAKPGYGGSEGDLTEAFKDIANDLIYLVDSGSKVKDVIGYGDDYDMNFLPQLGKMELRVAGAALDETKIESGLGENETARFGFGADDTIQASYKYVLHYYANGEDGQSDECFIWDISVPVRVDEPVQLDYTVKLQNPKSEAGKYGQYDADGSEGYEGLLTNKSATLYPMDSNGDPGAEEDFPKPTVDYTIGTVTVRPADITIYMGGSEGYESVIENGESDKKSNSLPEPGFYLTLPDFVNDLINGEDTGASDLSGDDFNITFYEDGGTKSWKLEKYGASQSVAEPDENGQEHFIYRIVPAVEGQDQIRLEFTDPDTGEHFTSDEFEPNDIGTLNNRYEMGIYAGSVDQGHILMNITTGEKMYTLAVKVETGTLNVRYVTGNQDDVITGVLNGIGEAQEAGTRAYVVKSQDSKFYINGSDIDVTDDAAPSLLFDDVVSDHNTDGAESYDETLGSEAIDILSDEGISNPKYQAKYLDLVDANNGNAWLTTDKALTVYWPRPADTDGSTKFYLVHFVGLDREMSSNPDNIHQAIQNAVDSGDARVIEGVANDPTNGVAFTLEPEEFQIDMEGADSVTVNRVRFSPFVLVWGADGDEPDPDDPPVIIPDDPDPSDPSKPDTPVEKELDGRDLVAGEFSFTITATGANAKHVSPRSLTGRNDAQGNVEFAGDGFTFEGAGTYTFTVSEKLPSDDDPDTEGVQSDGVTYDESSFTVTAKVTKGAGGKLAVSWQAPERSIAFRNAYEPSDSVDVSLGATKVLEGRDLAAGEFTFELRDRNGQLVATAANAADGSVSFAALRLTEPGTYTYTITEAKGGLEGVTYDTSTHTAVITVTDNGDGTLTYAVSYDGGDSLPVFKNTYEEPAEPGKPSEPGKPGKPSGGKPGKPGESIPQTGDTIVLAVGGVAVAAAAAIGAGLYLRRRSAR